MPTVQRTSRTSLESTKTPKMLYFENFKKKSQGLRLNCRIGKTRSFREPFKINLTMRFNFTECQAAIKRKVEKSPHQNPKSWGRMAKQSEKIERIPLWIGLLKLITQQSARQNRPLNPSRFSF